MRDAGKQTFLTRMAERYCWDASLPQALVDEARIIRRVMDFGIIDDLLAMERAIDQGQLVSALRSAPTGSLRPRSWAFWHYRLRLTAPDDRPPPMPARRFA